MTHATEKPVRRVVRTAECDMVAEVRDFGLVLRPLRTRAGGPAEVSVPWGAIYYRAMLARVDEARRANRHGKRRVRRGRLA